MLHSTNLIILVILLLGLILNYVKFDFSNKNDYSKLNNIMINILTRSGNRETCFNNLNKSIKSQTYKKIQHYISNDNPECKYLKGFKNVVNLNKQRKYFSGHCPYNSYLNKLIKKVNNGWIIILDDDSKIIDPTFINRLSYEIEKAGKYKAIVFDIFISPFKTILPNKNYINNFNCSMIMHEQIDMACIAFHHSVKIDFGDSCGGDFIFFSKLLEKNLVKYVKMKPGIWANYHGSRQGNKLICNAD